MPSNCDDMSGCENPFKNVVLVLDTSSLLNICDAAISGIPNSIPNNQRFGNFCWVLGGLLENIRLCCFGGRMNVTTEVFNDEMSPLNPVSAIRNHLPFKDVCGDESANYSQIARVFEGKMLIPISHLSETEIDTLKQQAASGTNRIYNMPSHHDFSLLLAALRLSLERETILLTDDSNLQKAWENVSEHRYVSLPSNRIDTSRVFLTSSLSYLKHIYGCCKVANKDFFCLIDVISGFIDTLRDSSNFLHLQYERERDQIIRDVSKFNK